MLSRVGIIMCIPVIVWYIGACMVSILKINVGIKESTCGHQYCNTSQILLFGGYHKVRESFVYPNYYLDNKYHSKPY